MSHVYQALIRPFLFRHEPEKTHEYTLMLLRLMGCAYPVCHLMEKWNRLRGANPVELFGLEFPNMVGLAAGFDKNGECVRPLRAMGFGHLEVGTVTRHKQPGNPRPRLYRYSKEQAIVNRMGFNNEGAEAVAERLSKLPRPGKRTVPIGINIGKTKQVSLEDAIEDYKQTFAILADYADYFTINVSSPNTRELRRLQEPDYLRELLQELTHNSEERARKLGIRPLPLLVKIAPDLSYREIDSILEIIAEKKIDGVIATNTTINRADSVKHIEEAGGLSGKPLHHTSTDIVNYIYKTTSGRLPIIGVGGIDDPKSAGAMVDAGASLVQVYTGMVYRGPLLARTLARSLSWRHRDWL